MPNRPYDRFAPEECILRDLLAMDRTVLANERTLLAYLRTALAFFLTGVSFVKLFAEPTLRITGWFFIPLGVAVCCYGLIRYRTVGRKLRLHAVEEPTGEYTPKAG